jgi:2-dehydro-3-deoxyphosphooctonate aldolase (KDO 8-P synthase)
VTTVRLNDAVSIGGGEPLVFIGGPCVLESEDMAVEIAETCRDICNRLGLGYVFKASFDKANRTSAHAFRGQTLARGLEMLERVRSSVGVPVLTDIHDPTQAAPVAEVVDVLQIPAFLCRQTDLLTAAGQTGAAVNIKKGQFLAPWDMRYALEKLELAGASGVTVTERGTSFGYNTLVVDFRSLTILADLGAPVIFDATHSVQSPGGAGDASGGDRRFVPPLARAAAAVGVDGIFMEVHPDPDAAPSDGPNMLRLEHLEPVLESAHRVAETARSFSLQHNVQAKEE